MSGPSKSHSTRTPSGDKQGGNKKQKDDDGKMHHWGWGWGNVVAVIPSDPNPRVSVPWNEKSKFIHYVDRSGYVTSKRRPEGDEPPASEGKKDKSQTNVLRRLHEDEVVMSDDVETPSGSGSGKGKTPETKAETPGGKKSGKGAKRYIYIDRHGVISTTGVRLSKPSAGHHFVYRDGEISHTEDPAGEHKANKAK